MKLTASIVAALSGLLYLLITGTEAGQSFPLPEEAFGELFFWALTALLGLSVEPGLRRLLVRAGLQGFQKDQS
jgi:hypothetical protein